MAKSEEKEPFSYGEVKEMSTLISPETEKQYVVERVCRVFEVARSSFYRNLQRKTERGKKRGPRTDLDDAQLKKEIRKDLENSRWKGEGHYKVHARLNRRLQSRVGRNRVLKLMREEKLLSPNRVKKGDIRKHDGKITTDAPNEMWGSDGTKIWTRQDGWIWLFATIDHWNSECVGYHLAKKGDRFAAMESVISGVKKIYGKIEKGVATGLKMRMDHGSQYRSDYFQKELKYMGIEASMGYVREPETNGVEERFNRTLKEQIINGIEYESLGEVKQAIDDFVERYNEEWLLSKLKYSSPVEAREKWKVVAKKSHASPSEKKSANAGELTRSSVASSVLTLAILQGSAKSCHRLACERSLK